MRLRGSDEIGWDSMGRNRAVNTTATSWSSIYMGVRTCTHTHTLSVFTKATCPLSQQDLTNHMVCQDSDSLGFPTVIQNLLTTRLLNHLLCDLRQSAQPF